MHCFRIDAGSSSYPDAEFAIADMIVEISWVFISGICSEFSIFLT